MKKKSFRMFFRSLLTKFGKVATDKAELIYDGEGELEVGMEVFIESGNEEEVEYVPAEDGEYAMEDGTIIVVADGKVAEIRKVEEPVEPTAEPAAEENMEGEGDAPAVEPADIVAPEEPAFDAEEACRILAEEIAGMKAEIQALRDQVNSLLEAPVEEDAFSKQNKAEKNSFKAIMKCN